MSKKLKDRIQFAGYFELRSDQGHIVDDLLASAALIANFVIFSVSLHHKRSFYFRYNLEDQSRQETGELKRVGDAVIYVVTGSYRFVAPDGKTYRVNYVADENGFRAKTSNATVDFGDRFNPEAEINPTVIKTLIGKR